MHSDILRLNLLRNISYRFDCHNNVGLTILPAFLKPIGKMDSLIFMVILDVYTGKSVHR
jgi:hypothetical protein